MSHIVIVSRDVTERRRLETQLSQAQKLESIGQLAAGVAHEINTPTQYVGDNVKFLNEAFNDILKPVKKLREMVMAEDDSIVSTEFESLKKLLEDTDCDYLVEEIPNAIQQSLDGIGRVAKIVRAMKDFSHPATEKCPIDIKRAIETTITVATNEWKYVANVETDFDADLPDVPCMPGEFNQVILNLVVNASHAIAAANGANGGEKGTIRISTLKIDGWAEVKVQDTGTGIPEEIRQKIFDPFFTTKKVGIGTGQGLSIAHTTIVTKHAGTIGVDSEVGSGTCFTIRLPLEASEGPEKGRVPA